MLNISNWKVTHFASLLAEILGFFPRTIAPALRITEFSSVSNNLKIHWTSPAENIFNKSNPQKTCFFLVQPAQSFSPRTYSLELRITAFPSESNYPKIHWTSTAENIFNKSNLQKTCFFLAHPAQSFSPRPEALELRITAFPSVSNYLKIHRTSANEHTFNIVN